MTQTNPAVDLTQLALVNVAAGYNDVPVVEALNLTLGNGQIGCLLGPSGCGKPAIARYSRF
ncbi:MAG: hypothetical protein KTR20_05825 [Cellvibrionaceae bacterium]|nr:hypothetical protein [Cellvibrionaceae bacterium]